MGSRLSNQDVFVNIGGQNSEFLQGEDVRGNLGRGAKDCIAFGGALFRTIRDGLYSEILLQVSGNARLHRAVPATHSHYTKLRLEQGENGTAASILFEDATIKKIGSFAAMRSQLANEAQLRDINLRHRVILEFIANRGTEIDVLRPDLVDVERVLLDHEGPVPQYPEALFKLDLEKLVQRGDERLTSTSPQGILIKGRNATYCNEFFGLETRPESKFLRGVLSVPYIDVLIREYDTSGPTETNSNRIIRRDRVGLDSGHPFMVQLRQAVIPIVSAALDEIKRSQGETERESDELREKLDDLTVALRNDIRELLEDSGGDTEDIQGNVFQVIPKTLDVAVGQPFSLSLVSPRPDESVAPTVHLSEGFVQIVNDESWRPRSNGVHSICSRRFRADRVGSGFVTFNLNGLEARATIRVHEELAEEQIDYEPFRFSRPQYQIRPNRVRHLEIYSSTQRLGLQIGVEGIGSVVEVVDCLPTSDGRGFRAVVQFKSSENGEAVISAVDATTGERVAAHVKVREIDPFNIDDYRFSVTNSEAGAQRVITEPGAHKTIVVYGKHPANSGALGGYDEAAKRFVNESEPATLRMLAELFSYELAKNILERNSLATPDDYQDATQVMIKHGQYSARLVQVVLRVLSIA